MGTTNVLLSSSLSREQYLHVLEFAFCHCKTGLLVKRAGMDVNPTALNDFLTRNAATNESKEWPGTKLLGGMPATVYKFKLEQSAMDYLSNKVHTLYDWVHPEELEDLCFFREDGSVFFGSVAHEKFAFFELNDDELKLLREKYPALAN